MVGEEKHALRGWDCVPTRPTHLSAASFPNLSHTTLEYRSQSDRVAISSERHAGLLKNVMTNQLSRKSRTVQLFSLPIRLLLILFLWSTWVHAQELLFDSNLSSQDINTVPPLSQDNTIRGPLWQYGAYLDLGYTLDFNFPDNHRWRSKPTTPRVNDLALNMALGYVQKKASVRPR